MSESSVDLQTPRLIDCVVISQSSFFARNLSFAYNAFSTACLSSYKCGINADAIDSEKTILFIFHLYRSPYFPKTSLRTCQSLVVIFIPNVKYKLSVKGRVCLNLKQKKSTLTQFITNLNYYRISIGHYNTQITN